MYWETNQITLISSRKKIADNPTKKMFLKTQRKNTSFFQRRKLRKLFYRTRKMQFSQPCYLLFAQKSTIFPPTFQKKKIWNSGQNWSFNGFFSIKFLTDCSCWHLESSFEKPEWSLNEKFIQKRRLIVWQIMLKAGKFWLFLQRSKQTNLLTRKIKIWEPWKKTFDPN